ncbi:MAG: 50S ribosomal protein L19 [Elusimicrobia bacterium]|nr:50S ribosomal protein L19 [Elusimicrobiota bacterium]
MARMIDKQIKKDIPEFNSGDQLKIEMKVRDRIQAFTGLVIAKKGSGINQTVTLRKTSFGIGVEKVFPLHSPLIESIEVLRRGKVRRAKLYYMRERHGKKARIKEKKSFR